MPRRGKLSRIVLSQGEIKSELGSVIERIQSRRGASAGRILYRYRAAGSVGVGPAPSVRSEQRLPE